MFRLGIKRIEIQRILLRSVHTMRFCLQFDANTKNGLSMGCCLKRKEWVYGMLRQTQRMGIQPNVVIWRKRRCRRKRTRIVWMRLKFSHPRQFPDNLHNECSVYTFSNGTFRAVWRRVPYNRLWLFSTVFSYIAIHDEQIITFQDCLNACMINWVIFVSHGFYLGKNL